MIDKELCQQSKFYITFVDLEEASDRVQKKQMQEVCDETKLKFLDIESYHKCI